MADEISDIFDSDSDDSDEEHREAQATVKTYRAQQKIFVSFLFMFFKAFHSID